MKAVNRGLLLVPKARALMAAKGTHMVHQRDTASAKAERTG